jgi:hypothetical protein
LNQKVFKRIGYTISDDIIKSIVNCRPGFVEYLLFELRSKIKGYSVCKDELETNKKVQKILPVLDQPEPFSLKRSSMHDIRTDAIVKPAIIERYQNSSANMLEKQNEINKVYGTDKGIKLNINQTTTEDFRNNKVIEDMRETINVF